jgi:drug/metabolite transporter (DMT)-like permease
MIKVLVILLTALFFEAIGVVFLSKGVKQAYAPESMVIGELAKTVKSVITNPNFLAGISLEAAFFATLLFLMSRADVSFIWPLTALGFCFTTLAARFLLHEHVSLTRWAGVFLIIAGAALITWSEKIKPEVPAPAHVTSPDAAKLQSHAKQT